MTPKELAAFTERTQPTEYRRPNTRPVASQKPNLGFWERRESVSAFTGKPFTEEQKRKQDHGIKLGKLKATRTKAEQKECMKNLVPKLALAVIIHLIAFSPLYFGARAMGW